MAYGGEKVGDQKHTLRKGIDILLGTPGRLLQFLYDGYLNLSMLKYLVIDEADVLLDMGFYPDLMNIINNETMPERHCRLNLLFSATFPFKVMDLVEQFVNEKYYFITNHLPSRKEEEIPNGNIVQRVYLMNVGNIMKMKLDVLHKVLQIIQGKTLVFLNTKNGVKYLANYLNNNGYGIACLHGDMEQTERNYNLYLFTSGEMNLMVCTDVLSRGMDISDVEFVINFDMPKDIATYVHRIGRTGRCGNKGNSITFVSYEDRGLFKQLLDIMRKSNQNVPEWLEKECGVYNNNKFK
jgi:ATP-dependent RNA helicase DDX3X